MHTFKSNLILHIVHLMTIVAWGLAPTLASSRAFGLPGNNLSNTVVIKAVRHVEFPQNKRYQPVHYQGPIETDRIDLWQ